MEAIALTENEVASKLSLSVATLRAWRCHGTGPKFVRLGRAVRYLKTDLVEYLQQCVVQTSDEIPATAERTAEQ